MPVQQPWLPAHSLCPGVSWKWSVSPGAAAAELRGDPRPACRRFSRLERTAEGCGKPRCREGAARQALSPCLSPQRGPDQLSYPSARPHQSIPRQQRPGRGPHPSPAGRGALGPGTRRRRRAMPTPALPSLRSLPALLSPSLASPCPCAPCGARTLRRSPAAAASTERGASGCTGKFVSNFVVFSLVSALLACCLGSQVLILVALFR